MSTASQVPAEAFQACLKEAFAQGPRLIHSWCDRLVDALYQRSMISSEDAERRGLRNAVSELRKNQQTIEQGFAVELARAVAEDTKPAAEKKIHKKSHSLSSLSFDDLELMGDSQLQDSVDSARLLQIVSMRCEAGLAGFSARLSSAQGHSVVKADKNPLRPEIVSEVLLRLLQQVPVGNDARSRWLAHGASLMGNELQSLYVLLDGQLERQGVPAAAYVAIPSPADQTRTITSSGTAGGLGQKAGGAGAGAEVLDRNFPAGVTAAIAARPADTLLTLDHLHRLLMGGYDNAARQELEPANLEQIVHPGFSHTVPAAMDVLAELKSRGAVPGRAQQTAASLPLVQMRAQLKTEARSLGQAIAIEVVGLMIEQIANDPRMLRPVRELIASVEPAFLRLAVNDPRFFSDKGHPARRLLETITATSLAYSSEQAAGFAPFMQDLHDVGVLLTEEHAGDAQHFAMLLRSFENKLASRSRRDGEVHGRAVEVLLQAEQRNLMAAKIAIEIGTRSDFFKGNRIVTNFLTGPWAQVMAKERLQAEQGGAPGTQNRFSLVLGEVLWSLDRSQTSRHLKRLAAIIPGMLETLREGLLSIEYPVVQSTAFFKELTGIHQAALKPEPASSEQQTRARPDAGEGFDESQGFREGRAWLAPSEARTTGFLEDFVSNGKPGFRDTQPHGRSAAQVPATSQVAPVGTIELRAGDWVELFWEEKWLRARLGWISPRNTLYMFTSEGSRAHSMTGTLLQFLLLQGLVKVVSQQGVLEGALNSVARTAMRNSVDGNRL